jgi:alanyl-tRNA synthetase
MRVIADHIRAISFAIADGQLPSNNKAGYVIRRILRRAVRYNFTFLNIKDPFMYKLLKVISKQFENVFPELHAQEDFVARVIQEEEISFLRTLDTGIKKFEALSTKKIAGDFAFELYDTYGFPIDLTELMARENKMEVDMDGFNACMEEQKNRSRKATATSADDWTIVRDEDAVEFVGYDFLECEAEILRYRKVKKGNKEQYQIVLNRTPFYAESGGQVGDTGFLQSEESKIIITDTQKENNLIIHFADKIPSDINATFKAVVDYNRRALITKNHSATHLMHAALRNVLGTHVAQKGSMVNEHTTRFDFSHFAKMTDEEINSIEQIVNKKIRENIALNEQRNVPIKQAQETGAMALFGEKVRRLCA